LALQGCCQLRGQRPFFCVRVDVSRPALGADAPI